MALPCSSIFGFAVNGRGLDGELVGCKDTGRVRLDSWRHLEVVELQCMAKGL